jgi:hypothetical protein
MNMLGGFIGGLFVAWILCFFGINTMILEVAQPFIKNVILTNSHYYIGMGLIGLIGGAFTN